MPPVSGLSEREIYLAFGSSYAARGDMYERSGNVREARFEARMCLLTADVQGSRPKPYKVRVVLNEMLSKIVDAGCSCPVGGLCKHAAALSFYAIRQGLVPMAGSIVPTTVSNLGLAPPGPAKPGMRAPGPLSMQTGQTPLAGQNLSPNVSRWLSALLDSMNTDASAQKAQALTKKPAVEQTDFVLYFLEVSGGRMLLNVQYAKRLKTGTWGTLQRTEIGRVAQKGARYITEEDADICTLFERARGETTWAYKSQFPEIPEICNVLIERLVATGRCYFQKLDYPLSALGPQKNAKLRWERLEDGSQKLNFIADSMEDTVAIAGGIWYIDSRQGIIGPLFTKLPPDAVRCVLQSPRVSSQEAAAVSSSLIHLSNDIPQPVGKFKVTEKVLEPRPKLTLKSIVKPLSRWDSEITAEPKTQVEISFDYGPVRFDYLDGMESRTVTGEEILVEKRNLEAEWKAVEAVAAYGLGEPVSTSAKSGAVAFRSEDDDPIRWFKFVQVDIPELAKQGFAIEIEPTFTYDIVDADEEWEADAQEGLGFWFSLDLGITVEGRKIPLLPIIHQAIKRLPGKDPLGELDRLNVDGKFYAPLPDGRYVALPFERVRAVVHTLLEIFDRDVQIDVEGATVSLPQMMQLADKLEGGDAWSVSPKLKALVDKIKHFEGLEKIDPPANFKATLRPYQSEGLSWLNFIREFGLGGILADDMGLGKTIQALAHIASEKENGRVDKPYLVVCPTSVLPNWISEIKKFTPDFTALALTGGDRANDYKKIGNVDIVVTTYPLVPRDIEVLAAQEWQAVILDEAQYIKNPRTQVAQAVQDLRSDYKLCLTGTPIENHLGELWSQFNFLMPGFLRDMTTFNKTVRTPIEKHKNLVMQKHLAARVRPFLLRRTKELVAKDLPEKTEITRTVELEGSQRDLYETVRLAMYDKVREALIVKGLAKSQIVILDALLKLRQVCCDPRLVSLAAARSVEGSAKLDQLLEMIEELIAEGKKILLFSQFTSMLDLIEPELERRAIEFVQIRGDTKDRATPVSRFQAGEVPLFLLSLKAGGTGLNLTAADTVIHYDPWWNPAVENQATDRAHRIGQDKKVFVFKLIAAGTIEERMVELQEKKRAIAASIYDSEEAVTAKLTAEDLEMLFRPLA